jgi:hypothetical protein
LERNFESEIESFGFPIYNDGEKWGEKKKLIGFLLWTQIEK